MAAISASRVGLVPGAGSPVLTARAALCRSVLNSVAWLITQRSQVQILPPLPEDAGQRPDCHSGGRAF